MKIEDIFNEWSKDSDIDQNNLAYEAIRISALHNKYYQMFVNERARARQLEAELKRLRLDKLEFYTQGETKETRELGWKLPARGVIIKADANAYVDTDEDVVALTLKLGLQNDKTDFLKSIVESLKNRGYNLKVAMDFMRFMNGE